MSIGSRTIAAIDIGTNSIHMVVAKMGPGGFEVITREKNAARLGEGGGDMKKLGDPAIDRGIAALKHMRQIADVHRASVFAVATSAVREAKNAETFVDRASSEAGIDIQIISGVEEARLIHLGVLQALPLTDKRSILIDIGGGSTEIVVFDHLEELFARSFKMGAVRLTNRFFPPGSLHPSAVTACSQFVESLLAPATREIRKLGHDIAVVSSGTAETLAQMCWLQDHEELPKSLNGIQFTRKQLDEITGIIISTPVLERGDLAGMDAGRVDIILAGALILQALAVEFGVMKFTYSDYALREGVLLDAYRRLDPGVDKDLRHVAIDGARKLAARCDDDVTHSGNVARLSCMLFDELSKVYDINQHGRLYLETAALLANVGLVVSHARHHLHTYYIVRNADLVGFTDHEIELIAQIARYHRKSEPKIQHNSFAELSPTDQELVRMLSAILRIGIGLDRTHDGRTTSLRASLKQSQIHIVASGGSDEDLQLNLYAAQQRASLLSDVFQCPVVVSGKI